MRFLLLFVISLGLAVPPKKAVHPGKERWPIKTSLPDHPGKPKKIALADLLSFGEP